MICSSKYRTRHGSLFAEVDSYNLSAVGDRIVAELTEASMSFSVMYSFLSRDASKVSPEDIVKICDSIDEEESRLKNKAGDDDQLLLDAIALKKKSLEFGRYQLLVKLMKHDYDAYVATAAFLSPSRIPRLDLPNVQDVPLNDIKPSMRQSDVNGALVDDCILENKTFQESPLDKLLLKIFRELVEKNTGGISSPKEGIEGLLDQGRTFMLKDGQTPEAQHKMVSDTLGGLMTPVLPPFYRIFMSGIVPNLGTDYDGKQFGPWFYVSLFLIALFNLSLSDELYSDPTRTKFETGPMVNNNSNTRILRIPCWTKSTKSKEGWTERRTGSGEM